MLSVCYGHDVSMLQLKNVPERTKRALRKRATESGMTMSDYVLQLIKRDLERPTKAELLKRLERLRPIVSSRSAAEDLEDARRERDEELGW